MDQGRRPRAWSRPGQTASAIVSSMSDTRIRAFVWPRSGTARFSRAPAKSASLSTAIAFHAPISSRRKGEINRLLPLISLPLGPFRRLGGRAWRSARGTNLAIHRSDLDRVDGFDAAYSGWGREDSDIIIRLMRIGIRRKDGRFATTVLHLWHPENDRSRLPENDRMLDAVIGS